MTLTRGLPGRPRRVTDVVERVVAQVLGCLAVLLVLAAALLGLDVHARGVERADAEAGDRSLVTAVLTGPREPRIVGPSATRTYRAPATWNSPDGAQRTGALVVGSTARTGTRVAVWVDDDGVLVPAPATRTAAVAGALAAAALLLVAGGGVLAAVWSVVRAVALAVNARGWGREWERFGPEWTGRR